MTIHIHHLLAGLVPGQSGDLEAVSVSLDPSGRYAVAELLPNELFAAVRLEQRGDGRLVGEYVDHCCCDSEIPMLRRFSVNWATMPHGFCKLLLWAPEEGDGSERTLKRFVFDRALYDARLEERGAPARPDGDAD